MCSLGCRVTIRDSQTTAHGDWKACEARLAEVDRQIEAWREWNRPVAYNWSGPQKAKPRPDGNLPDLLLERERLQEESFRLWRRARGEAG